MKKLFFILIIHAFLVSSSFATRSYWFNVAGPQGTLWHWNNGQSMGSRYYWLNKAGVGSRHHWLNGEGYGSRNFWETKSGPGTLHYWQNNQGPGSRWYWYHGEGPGSLHYWNEKEGPSLDLVLISLCQGGALNIEPCEVLRNYINIPSAHMLIPSTHLCPEELLQNLSQRLNSI